MLVLHVLAHLNHGSIYDAYGPTVFVRGGYAFEGNSLLDEHAFLASIGYRNYFGGSDGLRSLLGWEAEFLVLRESEEALGADYTAWGLAALIGPRWQFDVEPAYRFLSTTDNSLGGDSPRIHSAEIGLNFKL